jgi:hypothetical protein
MFVYQRVVLSGSHANAATCARGRAISISVTTSTAISASRQATRELHALAHPPVELGLGLDARPLHEDHRPRLRPGVKGERAPYFTASAPLPQ